MPKMSKAQCEEKFVDMLLSIGVKSIGSASERGNEYYVIYLNDGQQRFWTNFSEVSLNKMGYTFKRGYVEVLEESKNDIY